MSNKRTVKEILTPNEYMAYEAILKKLVQGEQTCVNISQFADEIHLSRTSISSMLKKLDLIGVFEVKSAGMRGTYIKFLPN